MYMTGVYLASSEIVGLLGFLFISRYQDAAFARFLPLLIALATVGYVAYRNGTAISYKQIGGVSLVTSAMFVVVVQLLGFMVFPGLNKDMDFLSLENATRAGLMLVIGMVGNFLLLTLARVARKLRHA